jgi:hypothetical protein
VVVAVLSNAGAQVPVMPLLDVVGSGASVAPEHIGATAVNVGVTFGLTEQALPGGIIWKSASTKNCHRRKNVVASCFGCF